MLLDVLAREMKPTTTFPSVVTTTFGVVPRVHSAPTIDAGDGVSTPGLQLLLSRTAAAHGLRSSGEFLSGGAGERGPVSSQNLPTVDGRGLRRQVAGRGQTGAGTDQHWMQRGGGGHWALQAAGEDNERRLNWCPATRRVYKSSSSNRHPYL